MKKEVRGGVSLVLASAMLVASPMAAGMTETVQAEELTVDSKLLRFKERASFRERIKFPETRSCLLSM